MADSALVDYIRKHAAAHGDAAVRTQLIRDGIPPSEIDAAFAEAGSPTIRKARGKRKLAMLAVVVGGILLLMALLLGSDSKTEKSEEKAQTKEEEPSTFHGHYGYMLRIPPGYRATREFADAEKKVERVYIYPKDTDPSHFIHEGLYGHLGILKLEVAPRRVPQGFIGIDTLKEWVTMKLEQDKAEYKKRDMIVHGMHGFVVTAEKPFQFVRAHMVGEKVRFMFVGGKEEGLFTDVLSSIAEVAPYSDDGK